MPDAKAHDRVKVLLQREVDTMKKTGTTMGVAEQISANSSKRIIDGDISPFTFDFDQDNGSIAPVVFASGSALSDQPKGLASLTDFIESCY